MNKLQIIGLLLTIPLIITVIIGIVRVIAIFINQGNLIEVVLTTVVTLALIGLFLVWWGM